MLRGCGLWGNWASQNSNPGINKEKYIVSTHNIYIHTHYAQRLGVRVERFKEFASARVR